MIPYRRRLSSSGDSKWASVGYVNNFDVRRDSKYGYDVDLGGVSIADGKFTNSYSGLSIQYNDPNMAEKLFQKTFAEDWFFVDANDRKFCIEFGTSHEIGLMYVLDWTWGPGPFATEHGFQVYFYNTNGLIMGGRIASSWNEAKFASARVLAAMADGKTHHWEIGCKADGSNIYLILDGQAETISVTSGLQGFTLVHEYWTGSTITKNGPGNPTSIGGALGVSHSGLPVNVLNTGGLDYLRVTKDARPAEGFARNPMISYKGEDPLYNYLELCLSMPNTGFLNIIPGKPQPIVFTYNYLTPVDLTQFDAGLFVGKPLTGSALGLRGLSGGTISADTRFCSEIFFKFDELRPYLAADQELFGVGNLSPNAELPFHVRVKFTGQNGLVLTNQVGIIGSMGLVVGEKYHIVIEKVDNTGYYVYVNGAPFPGATFPQPYQFGTNFLYSNMLVPKIFENQGSGYVTLYGVRHYNLNNAPPGTSKYTQTSTADPIPYKMPTYRLPTSGSKDAYYSNVRALWFSDGTTEEISQTAIQRVGPYTLDAANKRIAFTNPGGAIITHTGAAFDQDTRTYEITIEKTTTASSRIGNMILGFVDVPTNRAFRFFGSGDATLAAWASDDGNYKVNLMSAYLSKGFHTFSFIVSLNNVNVFYNGRFLTTLYSPVTLPLGATNPLRALTTKIGVGCAYDVQTDGIQSGSTMFTVFAADYFIRAVRITAGRREYPTNPVTGKVYSQNRGSNTIGWTPV